MVSTDTEILTGINAAIATGDMVVFTPHYLTFAEQAEILDRQAEDEWTKATAPLRRLRAASTEAQRRAAADAAMASHEGGCPGCFCYNPAVTANNGGLCVHCQAAHTTGPDGTCWQFPAESNRDRW